MLTVHEDERQKEVGLRAAYHGFVAMFISALAVSGAGLFLLGNDAVAFAATATLLVGMVAYHVSLWRGGWFEYVREMTNRTPADRARARSQAARWVAGMAAWLVVWGYALEGRTPGRALLGAIVSAAVVGALLWLVYLRRPRDDDQVPRGGR